MSFESMPASGSSLSNSRRMLLKAARGAQTEHQVGAGDEAILLKKLLPVNMGTTLKQSL